MIRAALPTFCFALLLAPCAAHAREFLIRPDGSTRVVFLSKATMESFKGKTTRVEGRIVVDPSALGDSVTVDVEVDLASLDTGIRKRNQDMRENHLETSKYAKAVFHGATVLDPRGGALEPGKQIRLDLEGTFTLHGVSRRLRTPVQAIYEPKGAGGRIRFETTFPVSLAAYNISRPQFLFLRVADVQQVTITGAAAAP